MPATASFRAFHQEAVAADVKETLCRVSEAQFLPEENANIPNVSYEVGEKHVSAGYAETALGSNRAGLLVQACCSKDSAAQGCRALCWCAPMHGRSLWAHSLPCMW